MLSKAIKALRGLIYQLQPYYFNDLLIESI